MLDVRDPVVHENDRLAALTRISLTRPCTQSPNHPAGYRPNVRDGRHPIRRWLRRPIWLGSLRRTIPISEHWGFDRGTPVDRYYIERFLEERSGDIRGRVLEVKDSRYTDRFGSAVEVSDVLDIDSANPGATLVADLAAAEEIPSESFDCLILTQVLHYIYEVESAIGEAHRLLRPEGVLLATVPAVSKFDRSAGVRGDYWRFTRTSCARLFGEVFGEDNITVQAHGNVLTAIAFLAGLAREDLSDRELDEQDESFPVVVTVRAVKR
jgi:SAM-dependent methyltransferase